MTRSSTATLIAALRILARDIDSDDGVANAAIAEAADRLEELRRDVAIVLPAISYAAGKHSRRTKAGREFRAASDRLAVEVLL